MIIQVIVGLAGCLIHPVIGLLGITLVHFILVKKGLRDE